MEEEGFERAQRRGRRASIGKSVFYSLGYLVLMIKDAIIDDIARIWNNMRLFLGMVLVLSGVLRFSSGRYCDGNVADHFSCTRPTTYYYFSEVSIALIIIGAILIVLWFLGRGRSFER